MSSDPLRAARLAVVSPHLDDGVFSCGDLLAAYPGATMITVFAGRPPSYEPMTQWDLDAGFRPGDEPIALRREEDRAALALLDAKPLWLDHLDSQYGRSPSAEEIAPSLEQALTRAEAQVAFIPLGLLHEDHRLAHQAARVVMQRLPSVTWLAYEDSMYRRLPGVVQERLEELRQHQILATPVDVPVPQSERKQRAIGEYRSQLRLFAAAGRPGFEDTRSPERFWHLSPSTPGRG